MAGLRILSCAVLAVALLLAVLAQAQGRSPCPPENPFCPIWVPCNYTEIQGPYCQNCSTRVICTAIGGLVLPCRIPGISYCVDGDCVAQPSEECATTTPLPSTTEEATTTAPQTSTTAGTTEQ